MRITADHFPPGANQWKMFEHRRFFVQSSNRRREPLRDYATAVNQMTRTSTAKGLSVTVTSRLDRRQ